MRIVAGSTDLACFCGSFTVSRNFDGSEIAEVGIPRV
jgi:hypothetical protein